MTKEKYMALADFKTLWDNKLKPWINGQKADKTELPTYATPAECRAIVTDYSPSE